MDEIRHVSFSPARVLAPELSCQEFRIKHFMKCFYMHVIAYNITSYDDNFESVILVMFPMSQPFRTDESGQDTATSNETNASHRKGLGLTDVAQDSGCFMNAHRRKTATCLITCHKGTGYVQMSDLPDDEDEVSWEFRCCGVSVVDCGVSDIQGRSECDSACRMSGRGG